MFAYNFEGLPAAMSPVLRRTRLLTPKLQDIPLKTVIRQVDSQAGLPDL